MFLNIMTRIPGYPHDAMLREVGGRGFPHLVILDRSGKVVGKPRGRSIQAFSAAMDDAPDPAPAEAQVADRAAPAMEFLRRLKLGKVTFSPADMTVFSRVRSTLNPKQITGVEEQLAKLQLAAGETERKTAKKGSAAWERAGLAIELARTKLGSSPAGDEGAVDAAAAKAQLATAAESLETAGSGPKGDQARIAALASALRARAALGRKWAEEPAASGILDALLGVAERGRDAQLFRILIQERKAGQDAEQTKAYDQDRLRRLETGRSPLRLTAG